MTNRAQNAPKAAGIGNPTTQAPKVAQNANMGPLRARCGDCQHYQPDSVNPPQGIGRCALTLTGLPPVRGYPCYPFTPRTCTSFQPLEDNP